MQTNNQLGTDAINTSNIMNQLENISLQTDYYMKLSSEFDNYLFLSITGTLLLSMNYINNAINIIKIQYLYLSWIILIFGLFFVLFSYIHTIAITYKKSQCIETKENKVLDQLSTVSAVFLLIGIISLSVFVISNISSSNNKSSFNYALSPDTQLILENGDIIKYGTLSKLQNNRELNLQFCYQTSEYSIILINGTYFKVMNENNAIIID